MGLSEQNHGSGDNRRGMSLGQAQLEFEPEFVTRHNLSLGQSHFDDRHILAVTDLLLTLSVYEFDPRFPR